MSTIFYTTYGSVRGLSGVRHRTRETAEKALLKDQKACKKVGGYSDRSVYVIGNDNFLYHDEECTRPVWNSGRSRAVKFM